MFGIFLSSVIKLCSFSSASQSKERKTSPVSLFSLFSLEILGFLIADSLTIFTSHCTVFEIT